MSGLTIKRLLLCFLPLTIGLILWGAVTFIPDTDIEIHAYEAIIDISDTGDMTVNETWDMTYRGDYHVRFRDIVYEKYPNHYPLYRTDENQAFFDHESAKIKVYRDNLDITSEVRLGYSFLYDRDEQGSLVSCYDNKRSCEALFVDFTPIGQMKGRITFEYTYTIKGAVTTYSDIAELNWKLFDYMEAKIKEARVTLNLPVNTFSKEDILLFYHDRSDHEIEIVSNNQVIFTIGEMKDDAFLEFRLLTPKDIFLNTQSINHVADESMNLATLLAYEEGLMQERLRQERLEEQFVIGLIGLSAVVLIFMIWAYVKYDKAYVIKGLPRMTKELPTLHTPAEVGYLFHMEKSSDEDVTATLLDLIRKGFINMDYFDQITRSSDADFPLTLKKDKDQSSLSPHEKHVIHWFFHTIGDGQTVTTKQIVDYGKGDLLKAKLFHELSSKFVKLVKNHADEEMFFESSKSHGRKIAKRLTLIPLTYTILTIALSIRYDIDLFLPFIVSSGLAIAYFMFVLQIKRRTFKGQETFLKWQAYKNYLLDIQNLKDRGMPSVDVYEDIIVYATVFKLAKKVMEQFKVCIESGIVDRADVSSSYQRFYYYHYMYNPMYDAIQSGKKNSTSTISHHQASTSGGRGSSGGGGGGGRSR